MRDEGIEFLIEKVKKRLTYPIQRLGVDSFG